MPPEYREVSQYFAKAPWYPYSENITHPSDIYILTVREDRDSIVTSILYVNRTPLLKVDHRLDNEYAIKRLLEIYNQAFAPKNPLSYNGSTINRRHSVANG